MNHKLFPHFVPAILPFLLVLIACQQPKAQDITIQQLRQADLSQSIICHDTVFMESEIWIDSTSTYVTRLRALLRTPKEEITAAALCDIIPSSELEMSIYYDIVEIEEDTTKPFDPTEIIRKYAATDSTNVLEAYMRMGEYVDGELAEAVFDDYIYLYHHLPQRFAQLRKLRSKRWNGAFDEWRKYYDE